MAIMHVHRDIHIDIGQVIMLSRRHKTRICGPMANILLDDYKLPVARALELSISGLVGHHIHDVVDNLECQQNVD